MVLDYIRIIFIILKFIFLQKLNYLNIVSDDYLYNKILEFIKNEGIVFIKLAQGVSSRNNVNEIFPKKLLNKITKLQDKCFTNNNIIDIKYSLLKKNPIAAGSIASIYLINYYNKKCILKRRNDNVEIMIQKSKKSLKIFLKLIGYYIHNNTMNIFDLNNYFLFLKYQILMDMEAVNQSKFINIFKDYEKIIVPKIFYFDQKNIIMEYKPGLKLNDFCKKYPDFEFEAMSLTYAAMIVMVKNNFLHGDLHYGNFSFEIIDDDIKLIILDFGVVCEFNDEQSRYLFNLINPKYKKKKRNENGILLIKSLNIDISNINVKGTKFEEILRIIINSNIRIDYKIFSCLTTLNIILSNTTDFRRKNPSFSKYLLGYLLENDYL